MSRPTIRNRIKAIENPRFRRLLAIAGECASHRERGLRFFQTKGTQKPCYKVSLRSVTVYLQLTSCDKEFEHDAAHELCHVVAGCCGFTYNVDFSDRGLFRRLNARQLYAIKSLRDTLGSFLTHAAVHELLRASGYNGKDWDNYFIEDVRKRIESAGRFSDPIGTLETRVKSVGWTIQYEEIERLGLPGLDVSLLKDEFRKLFQALGNNFYADLDSVRMLSQIDDLLDVDGCFKSTLSLAAAFAKFVRSPFESLLTVRIACQPSVEWSLQGIAERLQQEVRD